ncbi:ornithine aminotransferase [Nitrospira sp.]|nr:ornithine aminotransferase [Nitrospira sp.]
MKAQGGTVALVTSVLLLVSASASESADSSAAPSPVITDKTVTHAIERSLFVDSLVPHDGLDVETKDGIVTLQGAVPTIYGKERAVEHAQSMKGVRAVIDRIEVRASPRPDEEVRRDVTEALRIDPATNSMKIAVIAHNGQIVLRGTVQSWAERELAAEVVKTVRGVRSVNNELQLQLNGERGDAEIEADIRERLRTDVWLTGRILDVAVSGGDVVLRGTVGSALEKNRALSRAHVLGVKTVDGNDITVEWWARNYMRQDDYVFPTDREIARSVKDALRHDPRVWTANPDVEVVAGAVTLRGVVGSLSAKRAAEADASDTLGIRTVNNYLQVRPAQSADDDGLAKAVRSRLAASTLVDRYDIRVAAHHGTVVLTGSVDSYAEKLAVGELASRIEGVTGLRNRLAVEGDGRRLKSDHDIKRGIQDELWWSPFVDQEQVQVDVRDGVATLTGRVHSWWEKNRATKNAFEGGARDVRNELEVQ